MNLSAPLVDWGRRHLDGLVAAVLSVAAVAIMAGSGILGRAADLPAAACVVAVTAPVAWRRRWPVPVAVLTGAAVAGPHWTVAATAIYNSAPLTFPLFASVFMVGFSLGADCPWRRSLLGLAPLTAGLAISAGTFNPLMEMVTVGPWLAGLVLASRRRIGRQLEQRVKELDEERDLFADRSVRYERARIARELHDIVAHSVSLMVVQANAGIHLSAQDLGAAAEAFDSIADAAAQARAELDLLVALLQPSAGSPEAALSTPGGVPVGLRIVDELVRRVAATGLAVSCQVIGDVDDLAPAAADTAYRLVQEALTNALKHAPGSPIDVRLCGRADLVEVAVVDRGSGAASPQPALAPGGGGHGLAGMRERVGACGGTLEAGPSANGGWQVRALLPRRGASMAAASWRLRAG